MPENRRPDIRGKRTCLTWQWLMLVLYGSVSALHIPDTTSLKKQYRVLQRSEGLPARLFRTHKSDTLFLDLAWKGNAVEEVTYRQKQPFEGDVFSEISSRHSQGATWHELPDESTPALRDRFPGLEQQWFLQGFEQTGWLGAGLHQGVFFLTFLRTPPDEPEEVTEELRMRPSIGAYLDTSSLWLRGGCGENDTNCFISLREKDWKVFVTGRPVKRLRLEQKSGESLRDIRETFFSLSPEQHAEYAADLSGVLFMEAQIFLTRAAQNFPQIFNWPSWQMQSLKKGRIPINRFRDLLAEPPAGPFLLPALALDLPNGRLEVALDFEGRFILTITAE